MRKFLLIIMLLYLIGFVFFKSDTIVTKQWKEDTNGMEYFRTSYSLNWDNFFSYFKKIYKDISSNFIKKQF